MEAYYELRDVDLATDPYFAGIFSVGVTLAVNFYFGPASATPAEAGQQATPHRMTRTRLSTVMTLAGVLTVLAGYSMYWLSQVPILYTSDK